MEKLYERIDWHNQTNPALNETNLNLMSKAIDDIDDRLVLLSKDVLEVTPQIAHYLEQAEDLYHAMETLSENPPYIGENGNWYVWDIEGMEYVDSGVDASITVAIQDITMLNYGATPYVTNTGTDTDPIFHLFIPRAATVDHITKTGTHLLIDTYTVTMEDGHTETFTVTNGRGIVEIEKTSTSGNVDTYTITYNDETTSTFEVRNGDGFGDMTQAAYDANGNVVNGGGIENYVKDAANSPQDGEIYRYNSTNARYSNVAPANGVTKISGTVQEGVGTCAIAAGSHSEGGSTCAGLMKEQEGYATQLFVFSNQTWFDELFYELGTVTQALPSGSYIKLAQVQFPIPNTITNEVFTKRKIDDLTMGTRYEVYSCTIAYQSLGSFDYKAYIEIAGQNDNDEYIIKFYDKVALNTASELPSSMYVELRFTWNESAISPYGNYSHAEGYQTRTTMPYAHAEGFQSCADGSKSHVEGSGVYATGEAAHAEGFQSCATGKGSHVEGWGNEALKDGAHAEGRDSTADGLYAHAEGRNANATKTAAHAEGYATCAFGNYAHSEGAYTCARGEKSHAEGSSTYAYGNNAHAEGSDTYAYGDCHAEGTDTTAMGASAHAEGMNTYAKGKATHTEGWRTRADGFYSHTEGTETCAVYDNSHVEGRLNAPYKFYTKGDFDRGMTTTQFKSERINERAGIQSNSDLKSFFNLQNIKGNGINTQRDNACALDFLGNMFLAGAPFIRRGIIEGQLLATSRHNYELEPGAMYMLFCWSNLISTGAWRGMQSYIIAPNHGFGTSTSAQRGVLAQFNTQGTVGVVLEQANRTSSYVWTDPLNGTTQTRYKYNIGIGCCTTDCRVRYSLVKVLGSYDDFSQNEWGDFHSAYYENEGRWKVEVFNGAGSTSDDHNIDWFNGKTADLTFYYDYWNVKKAKPWTETTITSNYAVRMTQYVKVDEDFSIPFVTAKSNVTNYHMYLEDESLNIRQEVAENGTAVFAPMYGGSGWLKVVITYYTSSTGYCALNKDLYRYPDLVVDSAIGAVYPEMP